MTADERAFREAEARYWRGVASAEPSERVVHLAGLGADVRVLEYGEGPPLLFLHGGPNAGSTWAPLVGKMDGYRCLVVDRPGCGLSSVARNAPSSVREYVVRLVQGLLEALEPSPVGIVASSFGSYAVLAHSLARPGSTPPTVHFGCPGLVQGSKTPLRFMLLFVPGLRSLLLRLDPPTVKTAKKMFRQIGHGKSIDSGRVPEVGHEWYASLLRHTRTRENDLEHFTSVRPRDMLRRDELGSATGQMSFFWGADDTFGGVAVAEAMTGGIRGASLEILPDAGHLPWIDDPTAAGAHLRRFMAQAVGEGGSA